MEIITNRNGQDRAIQRVTHDCVRVSGESSFLRKSADETGKITMLDFEGGPAFNVGAKFKFEKMEWKINEIVQEDVKHKDLVSVRLYVSPVY